jgi:hypothetical protein
MLQNSSSVSLSNSTDGLPKHLLYNTNPLKTSCTRPITRGLYTYSVRLKPDIKTFLLLLGTLEVPSRPTVDTRTTKRTRDAFVLLRRRSMHP